MKKALFVVLAGISITAGANISALAGDMQVSDSASVDARIGLAPHAVLAGASNVVYQGRHRVVRSTRHLVTKANRRVAATVHTGVKVEHRTRGQLATTSAHASSNAGTNIDANASARVKPSYQTSVEAQQFDAADITTHAKTSGQAQVKTHVQVDAGINTGVPVKAAVGVAGDIGTGVGGLLR